MVQNQHATVKPVSTDQRALAIERVVWTEPKEQARLARQLSASSTPSESAKPTGHGAGQHEAIIIDDSLPYGDDAADTQLASATSIETAMQRFQLEVPDADLQDPTDGGKPDPCINSGSDVCFETCNGWQQ